MKSKPDFTPVRINSKTFILVKNCNDPEKARERFNEKLLNSELGLKKKPKEKDIAILEKSIEDTMENIKIAPDSERFKSALKKKQERLTKRVKKTVVKQ